MKKIIMMFSAIAVFAGNINSQELKVLNGDEFKLNMKTAAWSDIDMIGYDDNFVYYIFYSFSKIYSGAYIGSKKIISEKFQGVQ